MQDNVRSIPELVAALQRLLEELDRILNDRAMGKSAETTGDVETEMLHPVKMDDEELVALEHHLTANHWPPLPNAVPLARQAIETYRDGRSDEVLEWDTPEGRQRQTAAQVVEGLRLEFWTEDY